MIFFVASFYFGICYITTKSEKHKQEVNRLVENIIDLLKQQAQYRPNEGYLPIIHIRDQLIPPNERQSKIKSVFFLLLLNYTILFQKNPKFGQKLNNILQNLNQE